MIDSYRPGSSSVLIDSDKDRELIVCIAPDNWRHGEDSQAQTAETATPTATEDAAPESRRSRRTRNEAAATEAAA